MVEKVGGAFASRAGRIKGRNTQSANGRVMAPTLSASQHEKLEAMLKDGCSNRDIMEAVDCKERTVTRARLYMRLFGATKAPRARVGRRSKIEPVVQEALFERLLEEPNMQKLVE